MGLSDLFNIKSKARAKQDAADYEMKIFPFGDKQKERVRRDITAKVKSEKASANDVFFQYIVYREIMDQNDSDAYSQWYHSGIGKLFTHEQKALIRAYAFLDKQLSSDGEIDEIELKKLAEQYAAEEAPEKTGFKKLLKF